MADRADELDQLELWAGEILRALSPAQRNSLMRRMVTTLRRSQVDRIRAQKNPDGSGYAARKRKAEQKPANRPIRFLYRKANGQTRVADLKSWRNIGPHIIGFDREAEGIRTFRKSRIQRHLPPEGGSDPGGMPSRLRGRGGAIRRKSAAMFQRIRTAANLRSGVDDQSLWVGFTDRASRIARIHQFGLKDRVAKNGPEAQYPQRQLLGFSQEDREALMSLLLDHIEPE